MLAIKANDAQFFVQPFYGCISLDLHAECKHGLGHGPHRLAPVIGWFMTNKRIHRLLYQLIRMQRQNFRISAWLLHATHSQQWSVCMKTHTHTHQNTDISIYNSINIRHSFAGHFMSAVKSCSNWPMQHCHFADSTWHIQTHTHTSQPARPRSRPQTFWGCAHDHKHAAWLGAIVQVWNSCSKWSKFICMVAAVVGHFEQWLCAHSVRRIQHSYQIEWIEPHMHQLDGWTAF